MPTTRRIIALWFVGSIVGTTLIAISSPLFVRSYVPLEADTLRGVWTLAADHTYRWRSEGYANTQIGPLGMPGKGSVGTARQDTIRIALWGDSQAEGVCVADHEKIFAQAERLSSNRVEVFPFARSGENAADWLTQMPAVEDALSIDIHVLLIVDVPDLAAAVDAPLPPPSKSDIAQANRAFAARLPAFVIQAARNLLTESDGSTHRQLRFSVGPIAADRPDTHHRGLDPSQAAKVDWEAALTAVDRISDRPTFLLYAPKVPEIVNGNVIWRDDTADEFNKIASLTGELGLTVIDVRDQLRQSARQGRWPHGFDNGQIGSGHLNAVGNQILASRLISAADDLMQQRK